MRPAWRAVIAMAVVMVMGFGGLGVAQAQGGCSANAALDFGVAGPCQRAVLMAGVQSGIKLGSYNGAGRFEPDGAALGLTTLQMGGGFKFSGEVLRRLQLHADAGLSLVAGGAAPLGAARAGARWMILEDLKLGFDRSLRASRRPYLEMYAHLRHDSPAVLQELEASPGHAPGASAGVRALKYMTYRDVVSLRLEGGYRAGSAEAAFGVSWSRVEAMRWAAGLNANVRLRSRGPQLRAEAGIFCTWMLRAPDWELGAHLLTDWVGPLGAYRVGGVGPRLGVSLQRNFL
ncbi:hypothetical protein FRC98_15365 [Lujinxingia vulgaris]|uniref:Uncharacterized protein n=1 Tax=Lujinxingia vulgaris TaxID=2600176 RepID=A0A5C6X5P2_9DELT|nr:hypothetical protein [Lujinxingia vulgaris]TXD35586.1 hypothetical protein FRC98_15365 [Lujinxingia vulgaris]